MEESGKINVYTCQNCKKEIVTQNIVEGVTPFMIGCDAEGCEGLCHSAFYRVPQNLLPDYFWIKMGDDDLRKEAKKCVQELLKKDSNWGDDIRKNVKMEPEDFMLQGLKEHADNGGLFHVKTNFKEQ